jgi:hypothetical protein
MNITDFLPNVKCPYCGKPTIVAISGFGGRLNNREKQCKYCKKVFYVQILVETTVNKVICDGEIKGLEDRIKFLNKQREELYSDRLVKYEFAQRLNTEAIEITKEMRRKRDMN